MKLELVIFGITGFLVINTYHDGKYTEMLKVNQKYIKMIMYAFLGLTMYLFIKKKPNESRSMLAHATNIIKYMPIDKNTSNLITPFLDFNNSRNTMTTQMQRIATSGSSTNNRSVSETKKKYVAAEQNWKCMNCHQSLQASFEVHHKIPLFKGGNNQIDNLEALCRNCHGEKTIHEKII